MQIYEQVRQLRSIIRGWSFATKEGVQRRLETAERFYQDQMSPESQAIVAATLQTLRDELAKYER